MNPVGELLNGRLVQGDTWLSLTEERDNGDTRVASNDWDSEVERLGGLAGGLGDKGGSSDDVEGGDTKEPLWVVDTLLLENLGDDWDSRVDWVGDDEDEGLWRVLSDTSGDVSDDGGVDLRVWVRLRASEDALRQWTFCSLR